MKLLQTLLVICGSFFLSPPLWAQETESAPAPVDQAAAVPSSNPDPFPPESDVFERLAVPAARADQKRIALCLRLETWEGTALEVARWQDGVRKGSSLEQVRESFLSGKAAAQLVFSPSIAIDQATAASAESISEWIYPTEYEPPVNPGSQPSKQEVPKGDGEWKNRLAAAGDHAVPTSFETRNAGQTLEATVQAVTAGESCWDVSMNFEDIASLGTLSYGAKDLSIEMPLFGSVRTGGLVRLKEGKWRLLSVVEPPRGPDGKPSDRRWVTLVRIDPEE